MSSLVRNREMQKKGWLASMLFSAFCLAGIITLASQANITRGQVSAKGQRTTLDPGKGASQDFGGVVPAALKKSAAIQAASRKDEPKPERQILHLR